MNLINSEFILDGLSRLNEKSRNYYYELNRENGMFKVSKYKKAKVMKGVYSNVIFNEINLKDEADIIMFLMKERAYA